MLGCVVVNVVLDDQFCFFLLNWNGKWGCLLVLIMVRLETLDSGLCTVYSPYLAEETWRTVIRGIAQVSHVYAEPYVPYTLAV